VLTAELPRDSIGLERIRCPRQMSESCRFRPGRQDTGENVQRDTSSVGVLQALQLSEVRGY